MTGLIQETLINNQNIFAIEREKTQSTILPFFTKCQRLSNAALKLNLKAIKKFQYFAKGFQRGECAPDLFQQYLAHLQTTKKKHARRSVSYYIFQYHLLNT